jgi:hypothetical protein
MATACPAPVFRAHAAFWCFIQAIVAVPLLLILGIAWLVSGDDRIQCEIRRILFRLKNCRRGNANAKLDLLTDAYTLRVQEFGALYGKDTAWAQWMEENRDRYLPAFNAASAAPRPITIAFRYQSAPIAYNPPWTSEAEHMAALEGCMELTYPGYDFQLLFGVDPDDTYANIEAGIPTNSSFTAGRDMHLYYETIVNHEFAHVLKLHHHYDSPETTGTAQHMPPGETVCLMDRSSEQLCSACRTALGIPLDVDNRAAIRAQIEAILARYPY